MMKYKCSSCGYSGDDLIFQFDVYTFCAATNEQEPEFIDCAPEWVIDKHSGEGEILEPVACPKCHAWGVCNFEIVAS